MNVQNIFSTSARSVIRQAGIAAVLIVLLSSCSEDPTESPNLLDILFPSIELDSGAWVTSSDTVTVAVSAYRATDFMLSNSPNFEGGTWQPMDAPSVDWALIPGDGEKRVYVKFTGAGTAGDVVESEAILLDTTPPEVSTVMPDPPDGVSNQERPVTLVWTPAQDTGSGVGAYRVFCDTTQSPTALAWSDSTLGSEIWGLNRLTTYHWRVEAVDRAGNAASTGSWTISTAATPEGVIPVTAGVFTMGSPPTELARDEDEELHTVQLTRDFYISRYEVTTAQYVTLLQWAYERDLVTINAEQTWVLDNLGSAPVQLLPINEGLTSLRFVDGVFSAIQPDRPMNKITWFGATAYCDWLSMREGRPPAHDHADWSCNGGQVYAAVGYRLPTESEWEFSARAGATTSFYNGEITDTRDDPLLDAIAWYSNNDYPGLAPRGLLEPNAWDLYDVLGNAEEWVFDTYGDYPEGTPENPAVDPVSLSGHNRVFRGGSYIHSAWMCRLAKRTSHSPGLYLPGFRVVLMRP